ncbi:hypothetical protein NUU61_006869 [Penicillium alfredii]|uniref:Uncharacterized protein n=1 Tax=Penicillium alfredii TaxID=1506179 RepID=A0A9W9F1R6_9EURO|nr:uncharacterized protein NUU61_006869 [Penicillium alfredii]KAJ5091999.1 hypothetical protein NUU61_006869 [Penicillium alfredii]
MVILLQSGCVASTNGSGLLEASSGPQSAWRYASATVGITEQSNRYAICLDFGAKEGRIMSCMGMTFPISVHAKPHHTPERPVYAERRAVIPPHSVATVPTRVLSELPSERERTLTPFAHDCLDQTASI